MENFVVAVFETFAEARLAADELERAGINPAKVQLTPDIRDASTGQHGAGTAMPSDGDTGGGGIGGIFRSLFGDDQHKEYRGYYAEAERRGDCVLTIDADSEMQRRQALEIIERFRPVDIDERVGRWRSEGWTSYDEPKPGSEARHAAGEGASPPASSTRAGAGRVFSRGGEPGR